MYKYKCKSVGDCSVANRGDVITSESMLNDPKCSECGSDLQLVEGDAAGRTGGGGSGRPKGLLVAGVAAAVLAVGGGAWFLMQGRDTGQVAHPGKALDPAAPSAPVAAAPASSASPAAGGLSPSETQTSEARRQADKNLGEGNFTEAEKKAARAAALEMIKTAVARMGRGDLAGAEKELMQARDRDATESLVYYNLAIIRLRQQRPDEALKQLEAAMMAGFRHFDAMDKDPDLDPLRASPKFKELMGRYPRTKSM